MVTFCDTNTRVKVTRALKNASLGLLIALVIAVPGCKPPPRDDQGKKTEESRDREFKGVKTEEVFLTPVMALRVERGEVSSSIATTCSIVPLRSRLLRTEESGRLRFAREWTEGDRVQKGDQIATLESETLEADLERERANVQLAEEGLLISRKSMNAAVEEYETIQSLYSQGIAAKKDVDAQELSMERAINSYRQEQISLEKARATLRTQEDRLEKLNIVAPFDGLLVSRNTIEGSNPFSTVFGTESITDYGGRLVSSDFAVCGIIDVSQVMLRCDVTSRDVDSVRLGQRARATVYSSNDLLVEGEVVSISKSVSQDTRAFQVDVLVENPNGELRPGMFGRVDIITETRQDTIVVPKEVITRRNNRDVVFIAEKGVDVDYHLAKEIAVETGLSSRDEIEVTWGLKEGDAVILRGFEVLQDQTPVTVLFPDDPVVPGADEEKKETDKAADEKSEEGSEETGETAMVD